MKNILGYHNLLKLDKKSSLGMNLAFVTLAAITDRTKGVVPTNGIDGTRVSEAKWTKEIHVIHLYAG